MDNFYDRLIYACIYACTTFLNDIEKEKKLLSSSEPKLLKGGN